MPPFIRSNNTLFFALSMLILVGGIIFWQDGLTYDPPMYFSGLGQSLSTDPAQYTYHARNAHLFGDPDPFDYPRWTVYEHSLTSGIARVWFALFDVDTRQSNMVGLLLTLAGAFFFALGLARQHRSWTSAALIFTFAIGVTLYTYGRLSYLENGLLLLTGVLFWVYSWWGDRHWAVILAGVLVAIAMLTGKLFGALLLPGLLAAILLGPPGHRIRQALLAATSFVVAALVLSLALYGTNLTAAFGYVGEQSYGLRGFPEGLSSPWGFIQHLVSYGFLNRLFYLNPDNLVMLVSTLLLMTLLPRGLRSVPDLSRSFRLALFATAFIYLGLMPLNYSPIRYTLYMLPMIAAAAFALFDHLLARSNQRPKPVLGWPERITVGLAFWLLTFHLIMNLLFFNTMPAPIATVVWVSLPIAAAVVWTLHQIINRWQPTVPSRALMIALAAILLLSAVTNTARLRRNHFMTRNLTTVEASRDLPNIIGRHAVLSGPYAPGLVLENDLQAFIHLFGVAQVDSTLFERYPITHLAVDRSNWEQATTDYPHLAESPVIATYHIRDYDVNIHRIAGRTGNHEADNYQLTPYEQAVEHYHAQRPDSALTILADLYTRQPDSRAIGILYGELLLSSNRIQQGIDHMIALANRFPTDYYIQIHTGRALQIVALATQDQGLFQRANSFYQRGVEANRYKADYANRLFMQTMQQFSRPNHTP
jgi:hypothetical protein